MNLSRAGAVSLLALLDGAAVHVGGCICGAVRYAATGEARFLCYCHCNSCRQACGAPAVAWGTFPAANFRFTQGHPREARTSPGVTRSHCERCGSSLTYQNAERPGEIDVTLATFDAAGRFRPTVHIWVEDKLPWAEIGDGLPQFPRGISGGSGTP